ncbi:MAG TPA: PIN domain-containing protein [Solirubrobacteraceae bacterium]|nr:PIN domain-containing protein [Solirubrobacteraceae bacterium]
MGLALLDSSSVVGYLDADDLLHDDAVAKVEGAVRAGSGLAISAITWTELLHGAAVGHRAERAIRELATDLGIAILPVDTAVAERAAALQGEYARRSPAGRARRLKTPDALILATADVAADVDTVICGDDRWPKVPGARPQIVLVRERR